MIRTEWTPCRWRKRPVCPTPVAPRLSGRQGDLRRPQLRPRHHMAIWVGTATALVTMKDRWSGTLMFHRQPSEEKVGGAKAMLADGLFRRFGKPDLGFALHDTPAAYGEVEYRAGVISSNSDSLEITFHGRGGHGAMPSATIDPILIAGHFVVDVQSVISREKTLRRSASSPSLHPRWQRRQHHPDEVTVLARFAAMTRRFAANCWTASSGRPGPFRRWRAPPRRTPSSSKAENRWSTTKPWTDRTAVVFRVPLGTRRWRRRRRATPARTIRNLSSPGCRRYSSRSVSMTRPGSPRRRRAARLCR